MHQKLSALWEPRRFAVWVVLPGLLLAVIAGQLWQPRYEGKTSDEWFEQAVRRAPPARGTQPESAAFQECSEAFRRLGKPGICRVVHEYVKQMPFYLEWYDRAAVTLQKVVKLPPRRQPNRLRESLVAHRLLLRIGPDVIPELIHRTRSRNAAVRARVATVLGELGPGNPQAQACLLRILGDASAEVVYSSLEVLWMTLPEPGIALPAIVPLLTHTNDRVRVESTYVIGCLAPVREPALGTLVTLLSDSVGTVRANAARAIGLSEVRSEPIHAALEARLGDTNAVTRFRAAEALARLYRQEATNRAVGLLVVLAEAERSDRSYFRLIGFNARTALGEGEWSSEAMMDTFETLLADAMTYVRSEALAGLASHSETRRLPVPPAIRVLLVPVQDNVNGLIRQQATLLLEASER